MRFLGLLGVCLLAATAFGQPVRVTIKDGKTTSQAVELPVDPTPRIQMNHYGNGNVGLMVGGKPIQNGGAWPMLRIDGGLVQNFNLPNNITQPLPPGPFGKKRVGWQVSSRVGEVQCTLLAEAVPSRPGKDNQTGKRLLDTCRFSYIFENKGQRDLKLEFKVSMDMLIVNNDGALYASPTTHPGKILNGVELKGKELPEYIWCLQTPNLQNPGFVATMTLKMGQNVDTPSRVVLTQLGAIGGVNGWDVLAQQAGDSACALFWDAKTIRPGEKRTCVWAYGGGLASNPENEGKVSIHLGGSFEPGKLFTIMAQVDDPVPSQNLTLELPPGMTRIEGKQIEPVPPPAAVGASMVLWKARVDRLGEHEIKIRSSTGTTQSKHLTIEAGK
jgi:hypothetical protein